MAFTHNEWRLCGELCSISQQHFEFCVFIFFSFFRCNLCSFCMHACVRACVQFNKLKTRRNKKHFEFCGCAVYHIKLLNMVMEFRLEPILYTHLSVLMHCCSKTSHYYYFSFFWFDLVLFRRESFLFIIIIVVGIVVGFAIVLHAIPNSSRQLFSILECSVRCACMYVWVIAFFVILSCGYCVLFDAMFICREVYLIHH